MRTCEFCFGAGDKGVKLKFGEGFKDVLWLDCFLASEGYAVVCTDEYWLVGGWERYADAWYRGDRYKSRILTLL